ncbi:uncharacterized protein LOC143037862 [Oratosquilla oratoria]|uniref:uncharacterized protein LOC143037862 n=1 Tax=Oratosquilla oratoria TaxID=337810 RepID=UPI003F76FBA2
MESSSAGALAVTVLGSIAIAVLLVLLGRLLGVWSWAWAWVKASGEEKTKLCQAERTSSTRGYLFNDDLDWIGLWPRTGSYKRFTNLDDLGGNGDDGSESQDIPIPPQPLRPAPGPPPRSIGRSDSAGGGSLGGGSLGGSSTGGGSTGGGGGGGGGTPSTSSSVVGMGKVDTPPEPARPAPVLERRDSGRSIGRGVHRRDSSKELLRSSAGDLQHSPPRSTNPFKNTSAINNNNPANSSTNPWHASSSSSLGNTGGNVRYMVIPDGGEGGGGGGGSSSGYIGGCGPVCGFVGNVDGDSGSGGEDVYGIAGSATGSPVRNTGRGSPGTIMRSVMAEKYSSANIYAMEESPIVQAHAADKSLYRDHKHIQDDSSRVSSDIPSFRNYSPSLNSVDIVRDTAIENLIASRMGVTSMSHSESDNCDDRRDYAKLCSSPYTSSGYVSSSPKSTDVLPCNNVNTSFSSFQTPTSNRIPSPYQEATLPYPNVPCSFSKLANATMHGMRDNQEAIDASRYNRDIERYPQLLVNQFSEASPRNFEKAHAEEAYKFSYSDKNDKYNPLRTNLSYESVRASPQPTMTFKSSNTYDSIRDSTYLPQFGGPSTAYDNGRLSAAEEPTPVFDLSRLGYDDRDPNYDDGIAGNYGRNDSPYERNTTVYDDNSTSYDSSRSSFESTLYGGHPSGVASTSLLYDISAERSPPPPAPMDHRQRRSEGSSASSPALLSGDNTSLNTLPVTVQRNQNNQFDSFDLPATPPNTASDPSAHFEVEYLSQNLNLNRIFSGLETDDRGRSTGEGTLKTEVQQNEIKPEIANAGSEKYDREDPSTNISGYITNLGRFSYLLKSEGLSRPSTQEAEPQSNRVTSEWVGEKQEVKPVSSPNMKTSSFGHSRSLDCEKEKARIGSQDTNPFRQAKSVDTDEDKTESTLRSASLEVRCGSNSSCNSLSGATDVNTSAYSNVSSSTYRSTYQGTKESDSEGVVQDIDSNFNTNKVQAYIASLNQRLQELPEEDTSPLIKTQDSFGYASSPPNSASFPGTPPNSSAHSRSHSHFDSYSDTPPSSAGFTQTPPNSAFSNPSSSLSDTPPNSADPSSGHSFDSSALTGSSSGILKRAMSCDSVNSDTSVTLNELEDTTGQITGYLSIELLYDRDTADLEVKVQDAKDLVGPDPHVSVDSYVRVFLLPDKSTNMQTRLFRRSANPEYREKFLFALEEEEVSDRALVFYMYASDKFANTLIGEALLKLNECDLSSKVSTILVLNDSGQKGLGYGEIMFSLSYLPTAERLTVVVVKARSLSWTGEKTSADPFVKVYVLQNGKKFMKKKTSVKKDTTSPVFNEAMIFNIPAPALHTVQLRLTVSEHTTDGKASSVGHVIVGTQATGKALSHWNQMMSALRKPIGMWHPLRR